MIKVNVYLTWSKIMALVVLLASVVVDIINGSTLALPVALPIVASMILGKQYFDNQKEIGKNE